MVPNQACSTPSNSFFGNSPFSKQVERTWLYCKHDRGPWVHPIRRVPPVCVTLWVNPSKPWHGEDPDFLSRWNSQASGVSWGHWNHMVSKMFYPFGRIELAISQSQLPLWMWWCHLSHLPPSPIPLPPLLFVFLQFLSVSICFSFCTCVPYMCHFVYVTAPTGGSPSFSLQILLGMHSV